MIVVSHVLDDDDMAGDDEIITRPDICRRRPKRSAGAGDDRRAGIDRNGTNRIARKLVIA
jgi:hypothetical protein